MPNWLLKSAVQRAIAFLPQSHRWNELLQGKFTQSIELTEGRFEQRLDFARRHLDCFFEFNQKIANIFSALELGTGWYPTVPIALFLCGASEVLTVDIVSHLTAERVKSALEFFIKLERERRIERLLPRCLPGKIARLREIASQATRGTVDSLLEALNIRALVLDAQHTGVSPLSIDFFFSSSVLEYIPRPVLANILSEFKRIARPGAVMSHFVNLGDEYACFDPSITKFNFLKYPNRQWKWLDSPFTRKNRLRISDYREIFAQGGCEITREEDTQGDPRDLESIRLAPEFQKYSKADLLVLQAWITAKF